MANNDMQKSQKLTPEQTKLIADNFDGIKKLIKVILLKTQPILDTYRQNKVDQAISYLADQVIYEWDETKTDPKNFVQFCATRCVLRYIDALRKMNKHSRVDYVRRDTLKRVKRYLFAAQGFSSEEDINNRLKDLGLNQEKYKNVRHLKKCSLHNNQVVIQDKELQRIDWEDLKENILSKAEAHFAMDDSLSELNNTNRQIKIKILKEYLIPIAEGENPKTLEQIGREVNMSESNISKKLHDESMQNFIKSIIDN